jgi:small-conductance mechanosensitive channel
MNTQTQNNTEADCAALQKELDRWQESARNWFAKYGDAIEEANLSKESNIRLRKQLRHCSEMLDNLKTQLAYALTEDDYRIKPLLQKILNPPLH